MSSDTTAIDAAPADAAQDSLDTERAMAPRVAGLTVIAGVFPLIGKLVQGPLGNAPKNYITSFLYWHEEAGNVIAGSVMQAIGFLATVVTVLYLLRAAIARGAAPPRFTPVLTMVGGVVNAVSVVVLAVVYTQAAGTISKSSGFSYDEITHIARNPAALASSAGGFVGSLALAFGLVMAALNAMRVGLLTRLMGYIGILAGVLMLPLLQMFQALPVIQAFWFVAVAALISGRWPRGRPIAWEDGQAHPWPTAAEQRALAAEAREARKDEG